MKCAITGETGNSLEFVKIKNRYYKNQTVYDQWQDSISQNKEIIRIICEDILDYCSGQVSPSLIQKKVKELSFYPNVVIIQTLEKLKDDLKYQFAQSGKFGNDIGKVLYVFGAVKNTINDVYAQWKREQKQTRRQYLTSEIEVTGDLNELGRKSIMPTKDISEWLGGDDL